MRWRILGKIKAKDKSERKEEIVKILLWNRDLKNSKQQEEFLNPKAPEKLTAKEIGISPAQINKAIARIKKAIKNKEKVIVYGDYDTDGVCATAIVCETLYQLGAQVMSFIPKREEGYGLKVERLEKMAKEGAKLVITVDHGIVAVRQAERARDLGLDLVITDHHVPGEKRPRALAIIHTTKLAGSGVAWFLAKYLVKHLRGVHSATSEVARQRPRLLRGENGLDLATVGTVADVVPLLGPNRSIVKYGLEAVRKTKRPGLLELYREAGVSPEKIGTYEIGFIIGPRLNATGRMEDPRESLRLLCLSKKNQALELVQRIEQHNRERRILTDQTTIHARNLWLAQDGQSALIFVYHESYSEGVIGLVARQLVDEFYRPAVILARRQKHWVASARSIEEFNIIEAIRACADLLGDHGGHRKAAGFNVKNEKIVTLRQRLVALAESQLNKEKLTPILKIDAELDLEDLTFSLYRKIGQLEPFGEGNPLPVFVCRDVKVADVRLVGAKNQHLKLRVTSHVSRLTFDAIGFGMGHLFSQLSPEKSIDLAFSLLVDEWNGQGRLQLKLKDLRIK